MAFDPQKRHRRSIRLKGYDYTQAGAYYFTVVAQHRACVFGEIVRAEMSLNEAGEMVWQQWNALAERFPSVELDEFIVMPNHMHGIVLITESKTSEMDDGVSSFPDARQNHGEGRAQGTAPTQSVVHNPRLGDVLRVFKSIVTTEYIKGVQQHKWEPFEGRLFQRNYWEHIIRNERELDSIREYILNNAASWENDDNNPQNAKTM